MYYIKPMKKIKSYQILQNNLKSNPKINFTCEESTLENP